MLNPPYFRKFSRAMRWQEVGRGGTIYYPIWLAYATATLGSEHQIRLLDAPARNWGIEDVIRDITEFRPHMVVLESSFTSWQNDVGVAEAIKQSYYEAIIVIVGPPTSQLSNFFLANCAIDVVIRGEFDFTLAELAEALEKGTGYEDILGISYKERERIVNNPERRLTSSVDLDAIPFVSEVYKRDLNVRDYLISSALYPEVQIMAGRGCPHQCTFCVWPQLFTGKKVRMRSVDNFIEEIEWIRDNLPEVKEIVIEDDTFTLRKSWIKEFCEEMIRRKIKVTWSCQARADLSYELLKKMKMAGCRKVIVGFESGSDVILRNIKKGLTVSQMRSFVKDVKRSGILLQGDFVIGLPGENAETMKMTRKFIYDVKPEILQVSIGTPYPGTEFYDWVKNQGYLIVDDPVHYLDKEGHQTSVISYPELSNIEIAEAVDKVLKEYYISLGYLPLFLKQIVRKNGLNELIRLIRSARVFVRYIRREKETSEPSQESLKLVSQKFKSKQ